MPKKKNPKSKSYAFRLHPDDQREADAIEIIESFQTQGYSLREIMTDAILRASGHTPEMYKESGDAITKGFIETTLEDFAGHIISELRAKGMISKSTQDEQRNLFDEDEDSAMMRNMAEGYLSRSKRK